MRPLKKRYGHIVTSRRKELLEVVRPHVKLFRDNVTGIAWIEDGTSGTGTSAHPHIHGSGSVAGMRKLGRWRKGDRTVKSHGWIYNIDQPIEPRSADDRLVQAACRCGGDHGGVS
jgi:hypothetical protein